MMFASYMISILVMNPFNFITQQGRIIVGVYRVIIGVTIFLIWLLVWKTITKKYFDFINDRRKDV